MIRTLLKVGSW